MITGQDLSFTGLKPSTFQFQAQIFNKCNVVDLMFLGSENKTKVPLYFSMFKHDGLHC